MCRTSPCSESSEVAIGRRLRAASSRPSHFNSSVVRWYSSQASSIARSPRRNPGSARRSSSRSPTISALPFLIELLHECLRRHAAPRVGDQLLELAGADRGEPDEYGVIAVVVILGEEFLGVRREERLLFG